MAIREAALAGWLDRLVNPGRRKQPEQRDCQPVSARASLSGSGDGEQEEKDYTHQFIFHRAKSRSRSVAFAETEHRLRSVRTYTS